MAVEDVKILKKRFDEVVLKYDLKDKSDEIVKFMVLEKNFTLDEFSQKFSIEKEDAKIFLDFIRLGINFKEGTL